MLKGWIIGLLLIIVCGSLILEEVSFELSVLSVLFL